MSTDKQIKRKEAAQAHYNETEYAKIEQRVIFESAYIRLMLNGHTGKEISESLGISESKCSRMKKKHFPTLPTPPRDGSIAIQKDKDRRERWSELNKRDRRIVRMLHTQSYAEVAHKNNVSIGTVHNIAKENRDELSDRKVLFRGRKGQSVEIDK